MITATDLCFVGFGHAFSRSSRAAMIDESRRRKGVPAAQSTALGGRYFNRVLRLLFL
jgi:hypothetical protein